MKGKGNERRGGWKQEGKNVWEMNGKDDERNGVTGNYVEDRGMRGEEREIKGKDLGGWKEHWIRGKENERKSEERNGEWETMKINSYGDGFNKAMKKRNWWIWERMTNGNQTVRQDGQLQKLCDDTLIQDNNSNNLDRQRQHR